MRSFTVAIVSRKTVFGIKVLCKKLSSLLQDPTYSEEMLARQIYQELEKALNEPLTRERIPRETINQLRSIRHWLLPEENSQPELTDNPQGESQGDME